MNIGLATFDIGQFFEAGSLGTVEVPAAPQPALPVRSFLDLLGAVVEVQAGVEEDTAPMRAVELAEPPVQTLLSVALPPLTAPLQSAAPEVVAETEAEGPAALPVAVSESTDVVTVSPPVIVPPPPPDAPTPSAMPLRDRPLRDRPLHSPALQSPPRPSRSEMKQPMRAVAPVAFRLDIEEPAPAAEKAPAAPEAHQQQPMPPREARPSDPAAPVKASTENAPEPQTDKKKPAHPDRAESVAPPRAVDEPAVSSTAQIPAPGPAVKSSVSAPPPEKPLPGPTAAAPAAEGRKTEAPARIREFVVQVPVDETRKVDVHLVQRGNAVRVTVRTGSVEITDALRSELGELVRAIAGKGFRIEAWTPPESFPRTEVEAAHQMPTGRAESGGAGGEGQPHSRSFDGGSEHDSRRARRQWLEQFEAKLERD